MQKRLEHDFANPRLLIQALTHRSFSADHNERVEFLGDSVLNLAVAGLLYERLSDLPEGDLSRVRANLVKQDTLHQVAVSLGLPDMLRLGEIWNVLSRDAFFRIRQVPQPLWHLVPEREIVEAALADPNRLRTIHHHYRRQPLVR